MDKLLFIAVVGIALCLFVLTAHSFGNECRSRTCPDINYTATLTRNGCECLMKPK